MVNNRASTGDLKRHFGWQSGSTGNMYIDVSTAHVKNMAQMLGLSSRSDHHTGASCSFKSFAQPRVLATYKNPIIKQSNGGFTMNQSMANNFQNVNPQRSGESCGNVINITMASGPYININ